MKKIIKLTGNDDIPLIFCWDEEERGEPIPPEAEILSEAEEDFEKLEKGEFLQYGEDIFNGERVLNARANADNSVSIYHKPEVYILKYVEALLFKQTEGLPPEAILSRESELTGTPLDELAEAVLAKRVDFIDTEIQRQEAQLEENK